MTENRLYLLLTFFITFLFWGILAFYTHRFDTPFNASLFMMTLYILGVISPAIVWIIVKKISLSKSMYKEFLLNVVSPTKKWFWYFLVILSIVCFKMFPYIVFGGQKIDFLYMVFLQLPIYILIGGLEEIGWRGLLFSNLQKDMSVFKGALITGVIWVVWHLPLFFIIGTYQQVYSNFYAFALNTLGFSLILSAIFVYTRSIFLCIFSHAFLNSLASVFVTNETIWSSTFSLFIGILVFYAAVVFLNRQSRSDNPIDMDHVPYVSKNS